MPTFGSSLGVGTTVETAELADDAVTTAKITDLNVTTAKLAANAVTAAKLASTFSIVTQTSSVIGDDSGNFTTTSTTDVDITSATTTITTTAGAVQLVLFGCQYTFDGVIAGEISIDVGGTQDYAAHVEPGAANRVHCGTLMYLNTGQAAASTTFKARCRTDSGTMTIRNATAGSNRGDWSLVVLEIDAGG